MYITTPWCRVDRQQLSSAALSQAVSDTMQLLSMSADQAVSCQIPPHRFWGPVDRSYNIFMSRYIKGAGMYYVLCIVFYLASLNYAVNVTDIYVYIVFNYSA